jgi:putative peptidoglycan lipid II flippase
MSRPPAIAGGRPSTPTLPPSVQPDGLVSPPTATPGRPDGQATAGSTGPSIDAAGAVAAAVDRSTPPGRLVNLAIILMVGTGLSRVLGLVRESVTSSRFGTGGEIDAFVLADNVQSTIFELTSNGVLQAAMIPALAGLMVVGGGGVAQVRRAMGALMTLILATTLALTAAGMIWAPAVVAALTGLFGVGEPPSQATIDLAIDLVRWILPAVPLLGLGSVLMAGLHAAGRPAAPALGSATRNAVFIIAALTLSTALGVHSLALGTVLGALAIVLIQLPTLRRVGLLVWPNLDLRHPAVGTVIRLSIPVTGSLIITTAVMVVDRNLATGVSEGTVATMRYATTLVQTILGLVAAAVALAALPSLSRHHEADDPLAFARTLRRALVFVTLLIVPVTLLLAVLSEPVVRLIFQRGETTAFEAGEIRQALLAYLPGTLAAGYAQVLLFAFYARKNTHTPLMITVAGAVAYVVTAFGLVGQLGMVGLVLANSVQWGVTLLGALILGHRPFRSWRVLPWPVIAICAVGGGLSAAVSLAIMTALGGSAADSGVGPRLLTLALAAAATSAIYPVTVALGVRFAGVEIELPERLAALLARRR